MRLIDADALKEYFKTIRKYHVGKYSEWYLADVLEQQPTVDAVPVRHGKWTRHTLGSTGGYGTTVMHQCSECESMTISRFRYCPTCGARMDEE